MALLSQAQFVGYKVLSENVLENGLIVKNSV